MLIQKRFCSTVQLKAVENFQGKQITVYLPAPGGMLANSINYVNYDYVTKNSTYARITKNNN